MQSSSDVFNEVVQNLEKHQESLRIKKLIFYICKKYWENNITILNGLQFADLIEELMSIKPNSEQLTFSVYKLVKTLNRPGVYASVAKVIVEQMSRLYQIQFSSLEEDMEILAEQIESTQPINKSSDLLIDRVVALDRPLDSPQQQEPYRASPEISMVEFNEFREIPTYLNLAAPADPEPPLKEYDPFEVRLEIMQYTNTLRAKILLFSILFHPWDQSGQDWSTLRSYTLEDLVELLVQSGKSIQEIETQLYSAAKNQPDEDANLQTASVIVQSVQNIL